jgi:hypothetical protein
MTRAMAIWPLHSWHVATKYLGIGVSSGTENHFIFTKRAGERQDFNPNAFSQREGESMERIKNLISWKGTKNTRVRGAS